MDNYATPKHPKVKTWLKCHPRFHLPFTPTSASWLNMVEFEAAIDDYLEHHNSHSEPFIWTAKAADILAKVTRANATLVKPQNQRAGLLREQLVGPRMRLRPLTSFSGDLGLLW